MTELEKLKALKVGDKVKVKSCTDSSWCKENVGEVFTITEIGIVCKNDKKSTCGGGCCAGVDVELKGLATTKCLSTKFFKAITIKKSKKPKKVTRLETLIL